jgi:hypothetical protein
VTDNTLHASLHASSDHHKPTRLLSLFFANVDILDMASTSTQEFAALPAELRIKIWKHLLPGPRIVPVSYSRELQKYISDGPPPILNVCSESRSIFLSVYTKLIISPKHESAVFVDFELDTIFFDNLDCSPDGDLAFDLATSPHSDRILSCAIDVQLWEVLRVFKYDSLSEVKFMKNLKTLALVLPKDHERGTQHRRINEYGRNTVLVELDANSIRSEIHSVLFYVTSLRWDLEHIMEKEHWGNGPPNVQMWLL